MMIFGPYSSLPQDWHGIVYNFTSLAQTNFPVLDLLLIQVPIGDVNNPDYQWQFDNLYANYILSNDNVFFQFVNMIMQWYNGYDIFILIDKWGAPGLELLNESLIKFIQQRYEFEPYRINDIEDLSVIGSDYQESCSLAGLANLDLDKERYALLLMQIDVNEKIKKGEINEDNLQFYLPPNGVSVS